MQQLTNQPTYTLQCYHCGGHTGCKRDPQLELKWKIEIVRPQCSACRAAGVEPKTQTLVVNQAAKVVSEKKQLQQAELQADQQQAAKQPAPPRSDQDHDRVHQIVGVKRNRDGELLSFVHWERLSGDVHPQDQCTWESSDAISVSLDAAFLSKHALTVHTEKRKADGEITDFNPNNKKFKAAYSGNKKYQWLNLARPSKHHGWVLDGYNEWAVSGSASDASDQDSESESDARESGSDQSE